MGVTNSWESGENGQTTLSLDGFLETAKLTKRDATSRGLRLSVICLRQQFSR